MPGNEKEGAWVPQVSFTSGALNYFYTEKMYDASSDLVGWGLQGIDHEVIKSNLASVADAATTKIFVTVNGTTNMLASSNATQAITELNPLCNDADCANLDPTVKYLLVDATSAEDLVIASAANAAGSTFTIGSDTFHVASVTFQVNSYMTGVNVYATSKVSAEHAEAMVKVGCNNLMTILKPMSDDNAAMKKAFATSTLPSAFPVRYPAFGSQLQEFWATMWRSRYSLGGLWLGMADNSYIGYAAGAADIPSGKSQYTYIWGEGINCPAIPSADCPAGSSADKCAAVTNENCRRFWEVGPDLVPTKAYRNKENYQVTSRSWWKKAVASGERGWTIHYGTTVELPVANHHVPIVKNGQIEAVVIHQFDIGYGSSCNRLLKQFAGSHNASTVFVMTESGDLVATGGDDKGIWSTESSSLVKAADYADNVVISTVAKAIGTNTGSQTEGSTLTYDYTVIPLDSGKTANLGWVLVAVAGKEAPAKDDKEDDSNNHCIKDDGDKSISIANLVLVVAILFMSLFHIFIQLGVKRQMDKMSGGPVVPTSMKNPARASVLEMANNA